MRLAVRLVAIILLAALGFWLWGVFFPSPETVIRKRLLKLAHAASFSANDGMLAKAAGAMAVPDYFAPQVDIVLDLPGGVQHVIRDRGQITEEAKQSRGLTSLSVNFPDIRVTVNPDNATAVADVTLNARSGPDRDDIIEELKMTLDKTNGDWVIRRIQSVPGVSLH